MRKAIISAGAIVALALVGLFLLSAGDKVESAVIKVDGMTCDNCVSQVQGALNGIEGVKSVQVSLEDKMARVSYVASITDVPALEKAIAKLGYDAGTTKAEVAHGAGGMKDKACDDKGAGDCCASKTTKPST